MLRQDQPIPDDLPTLEELTRIADNEGQTLTARLFDRVAELQAQVELLEESISNTVTLEKWEEENGPASSYVEFFNDCFRHLDGHYPCPSVTSDYDKSVIFDAISGVTTPSEADIKTMQDNSYWSGFEDGREKP